MLLMQHNQDRRPTSRARQDAASASLPREGYRTLLATSRHMRRDHAIARDAWFAALKIDQKAELLFELRGHTERQFVLYRVVRGQAERIFSTASADIVVPHGS